MFHSFPRLYLLGWFLSKLAINYLTMKKYNSKLSVLKNFETHIKEDCIMKSYVFVKGLAQVDIMKLRSGMGYSWHTMVCERDEWSDEQKQANPWKGFNADMSKSIPSIELDWVGTESMESLLNDLRNEHGEIFFCENTVANAGVDAVAVAKINKLWCGGTPLIVYAGKKSEVPTKKESEYAINPQYSHMTMTQIKLAELAYDNLHNEGGEGYNPYRDDLYVEVV